MPTLWDSLIDRGVAAHERRDRSHNVVTRKGLRVESTPFGLLRWYLNPDLDGPSTQALYFCELEIPPGERSGKLRHQGGIINLVVAGSGYTEFDGRLHDWARRDVIALPIRPQGIVFQHVNNGTTPARLIVSWPNLDSGLGPAMGVHMEILAPAGDYRPEPDGATR
jgi:hypothetical protein